MTYFLKSGNRFSVSTKESMDLHDSLPADTYTVKYDKMQDRFYLEQIEQFLIRGRIYGDSERNCERILSTYTDRPGSTGVMLTGEKGSGKTLLAKMLSVRALSLGIPTIVINQPWCGENFNAFIQMIEQPTVILFDEFEKVYDREDQEKMLTLLDGVYPSKKLFVLTCNDKWRVNEHMRNRPGRIYYMLDYRGLDNDFIVEYCEENLKNKTHIHSICRIATVFDQFNFDMLKAMVEEMNRYDETPQQVMRLLNARPEFSSESRYKVTLQPRGLDIPEDHLESSEWHGNPLTQRMSLDYKLFNHTALDEHGNPDFDWETCSFGNEDLKQIDTTQGRFIFINDMGDRVTLSRVRERHYHWDAF